MISHYGTLFSYAGVLVDLPIFEYCALFWIAITLHPDLMNVTNCLEKTTSMRKSILLTFVLLSSVMASADSYFGKVLDGEGNPLIGAAVRVVGDKTAVVTGTDGRFELSGVSGVAAKVQVSYRSEEHTSDSSHQD